MEDFNKKYTAIILSSSYGEDEQLLIDYLKHLLEICESLKKQFSILPVLVFEKIEEKKKIFIEKKIEIEKTEIKPLILVNHDGKGHSSCLNFGIKNTDSKFIFRLDTDDKTDAQRIINQLEIMESKEIDICSGYMEDQNGRILKYPSKTFGMGLMIALGTNPIAHPTVCIKRESLFLNYNEDLSKCEDFDLWIKFFMIGSTKIKVFKKPLTQYSTYRSFKKDKANAITQLKIRFKYFKKFILLSIILLIGVIPNIFRIILPFNLLLYFRRKL